MLGRFVVLTSWPGTGLGSITWWPLCIGSQETTGPSTKQMRRPPAATRSDTRSVMFTVCPLLCSRDPEATNTSESVTPSAVAERRMGCEATTETSFEVHVSPGCWSLPTATLNTMTLSGMVRIVREARAAVGAISSRPDRSGSVLPLGLPLSLPLNSLVPVTEQGFDALEHDRTTESGLDGQAYLFDFLPGQHGPG